MIGFEGQWCAFFWFVGWGKLALGVSVCLASPNLELHVPFGFIRIGRNRNSTREGLVFRLNGNRW